jgi:hypothetical protein
MVPIAQYPGRIAGAGVELHSVLNVEGFSVEHQLMDGGRPMKISSTTSLTIVPPLATLAKLTLTETVSEMSAIQPPTDQLPRDHCRSSMGGGLAFYWRILDCSCSAGKTEGGFRDCC